MKKTISYFLLIFTCFAFSQVKDLTSVSTGTNVGFSALFNEKEQLYGYIGIYYKGKDTPVSGSFEYVYLDKNLNKVSNNVFSAPNYVVGYASYINKKGEIELVPAKDMEIYAKNKKQTITTNKIIDIKANTITDQPRMVYEDHKLVDLDLSQSVKERDKLVTKNWKSSGYVLRTEAVTLEDGSFLVSEYKNDPYKNADYDFAFTKLDSNRNKLWRYEFNKDKKNKINQSVDIIYFDFNDLYLLEKTIVKKEISCKLVKINLKSGNKEIDIAINNYSEASLMSLKSFNSRDGMVYNKKAFDDKVVFVGQLKESKYSPTSGCFRMIVDKKTNEVRFDSFNYTDAKNFIDVTSKGTMEKDGYVLVLRDLYFFKNGSVGLMYEKMKGGVVVMGFGGGIKVTDLIYFDTNEKFEVQQVKTFEKDKTRGFQSDYLFSQYINEGNDVAFFYKDYQKDTDGDKNWNLYINTIKSGTFNQEKIKISSKENTIFPYVAKEGYILLREYNKKSEYNGIRLEKLNY